MEVGDADMKHAHSIDELYRNGDVVRVPAYTIDDASRFLRIPRTTVRSWAAGRSSSTHGAGQRGTGPVIIAAAAQGARLSFLNLAEIYVLDTLRREYRLKLSDSWRAVVYLRKHFKTDWPLARQDMLTDGQSLFIEVALRTKEPLLVNASRNGQLAMRDVVGLYLKRIGWDESGVAARLYPWVGRRALGADDPADIVIDPRIAFGQPALARIGVAAVAIAERFDSGESIEALADDYGAELAEIQEAVRFALPLTHAA